MTMSHLAPADHAAPDLEMPQVSDALVRGTPRSAHCVWLVGNGSFAWWRRLQERAPGPRIDLRYLVEGAMSLLQANAQMLDAWMAHSRQALVQHVAGRSAAPTSVSGTVRVAHEGAQARTSGAPTGHGRHDDCRALQVGEQAFQWLKGQQGTTHAPRLDIRYLVEGALALLDAHPDLLPQVVSLARRSLREHLAELETHSIEPFSLERTQ